MVSRGHRVTVYCRQPSSGPFRGVELVYLPTIRHKYTDTIVHSFLSTIHLLFRRCDAALYCNAANAVFTILPRMTGIPVALNVDGLERNRKKWNRLAKAWYMLSERLATILPNEVVTDAEKIEEYYRERYAKASTFIAYGADTTRMATQHTLGRMGLEAQRYFLYVSRMEPENNALLVREAFESIATGMKLVLVGDAPYADAYIRSVRDTRDQRVLLPGAIYGDGYRELGSHCFAYIHATEVGGTHPALIEAMGRGALTLYLDTPENSEVAGGAGIPFTHGNLAEKMQDVLEMSEEERTGWREKAVERIRQRYSWEAVTTAYEGLLQRITRRS